MSELTEAYLTTEAENFAKEYIANDISGQLRKFYDDFKILEKRVSEKQDYSEEWFKQEILPLIKFVKAKIAYSAGRKKDKDKLLIPPGFKEKMDAKINRINSKDDFKHFMLHFQAIIAYYKYHRTQKEIQDKGQRQSFSNKPHNGGRG